MTPVSNESRPRSISCSVATDVKSLVIDAVSKRIASELRMPHGRLA